MLKPLLIAVAFALAAPLTTQAQGVLPAVPNPTAPTPAEPVQVAPAPVAPAQVAPARLAAPAPALPQLLPPGQVQGKYKSYLYQRYAADRKALAVVRLFTRRQVGGAVFLGVGVGFLATLATLAGTHGSGSGQVTVTVSPLAYVVYPGPFIGVGIGKLSRFNDQRLYDALAGYDRTGILPNYVQGRLREYEYQ